MYPVIIPETFTIQKIDSVSIDTLSASDVSILASVKKEAFRRGQMIGGLFSSPGRDCTPYWNNVGCGLSELFMVTTGWPSRVLNSDKVMWKTVYDLDATILSDTLELTYDTRAQTRSVFMGEDRMWWVIMAPPSPQEPMMESHISSTINIIRADLQSTSPSIERFNTILSGIGYVQELDYTVRTHKMGYIPSGKTALASLISKYVIRDIRHNLPEILGVATYHYELDDIIEDALEMMKIILESWKSYWSEDRRGDPVEDLRERIRKIYTEKDASMRLDRPIYEPVQQREFTPLRPPTVPPLNSTPPSTNWADPISHVNRIS